MNNMHSSFMTEKAYKENEQIISSGKIVTAHCAIWWEHTRIIKNTYFTGRFPICLDKKRIAEKYTNIIRNILDCRRTKYALLESLLSQYRNQL